MTLVGFLKLAYYFECNGLLHSLSERIGPDGQINGIKLKLPNRTIPGSVGAVVYLTGKMDKRSTYFFLPILLAISIQAKFVFLYCGGKAAPTYGEIKFL